MAGKKQLEPVDFDSEPVEGSVAKALLEGDRLELLKAMAMQVARRLDNPNTLARDAAALTRNLTIISKEIEELEQLEQQYTDGTEGADDDSLEDAPFSAEAI